MTLLRDQRLRAFHAVAMHKSFSKAAGQLCLTQQAVSFQIRSLEREVGTSLFARGHRTTELTTAGQTLFAHADRILALYREAADSLDAMARSSQRTLRISATHSIAKYTLPGVMGQFRARHPDVRILLDVGNSTHAVERLRDGRADVAITSAGAPDLGRLQTTPLFRDAVIFVVSKDHPWARKHAITLQDLRETPLIVREEGSSTHALLQRRLRPMGLSVEQLETALVAGSPEAAKEAAEAGIGVGILSTLCARTALEKGRLIARSVERLTITRDFYIANHRTGFRPPAVDDFIDLARQPLV